MEHRTKVTNKQDAPLTLWIEPWGQDYTLLPNETVDVVADGCLEGFYLNWFIGEQKILIYAEGDQNGTVSVYQNGKQLECGHHRR